MLEKFSLRVLLPGLSLLLIPALLLGQFGAVVQGTVSDSSGAVISDAKVTLTSNETQRKQTATSSSDGFYRFTGLAPGTYTLQAEAPNFSQQVLQNVIVNAEEPSGGTSPLSPGGDS